MRISQFFKFAIFTSLLLISQFAFGNTEQDIPKLLKKGREHVLNLKFAGAWDSFLTASLMGDIQAQTELLKILGKPGVNKDTFTLRVIQAYEKAAHGRNPIGMNNWGYICFLGIGVTKRDGAEAMNWFQKAAEAGNVAAMGNLGIIYDGSYGKKDPAQAILWLKRAADAGNAPAMSRLGLIYFGNKDPDNAEAIRWYRKAADAGDPTAMNMLAAIYGSDLSGTAKPDLTKTLFWFQNGAAAGDSAAMWNLGVMYETGEGVPKNPAIANTWFQKAMKAGEQNNGVNNRISFITNTPSGIL